MPQDYSLISLLERNVQWAESNSNALPIPDPQTPNVLWIGCADSRVPESVITNSLPGDIFVHRNIANQFSPDDPNALSALAFAVHNLKVTHVVVVGHTSCGGVQNAHIRAAGVEIPEADDVHPHVRPFLEPLVAFARANSEVDAAALTELNVAEQVRKIAETDVIKGAWASAEHPDVHVHGWIFDIETRRLRDLEVSVSKGKDVLVCSD